MRAKVAYLEGLASGLELPDSSKEARLLDGIVRVLGDFADTVDDLQDAQESIQEYLENIDEDLYTLENQFNSRAAKEEDEDYYEVECPKCSNLVCVDSDIVESDEVDAIQCPNCDEAIALSGQAPIRHE